MAVDYTITAGNVLAAYAWDLLKADLGWSADNYGGLVPVAPVQQQPELNAVTGPFIVFASSMQGITPLWQLQTEIVAFTIYSHKISDINSVTNLLTFDLKGYDEAARKVNVWLETKYTAGHRFRNFDFKTISISGASGPQPALQEGGRHDGNLVIRATYSHYDVDGEETRD